MIGVKIVDRRTGQLLALKFIDDDGEESFIGEIDYVFELRMTDNDKDYLKELQITWQSAES